ncbi:MAG TPA: VpsF family polysaccharide biosynthesis protein [Pararhizobium sp.]|nr:VpsF family polysaccharide biosynthesis protein [Pararhizobium sp.]
MTARWTTGEQSFGRAASSVPRRRTDRGIVDWLLVIAVIALMALSNYALEYFGIPYDSSTGSIISKIHPATYLFAIALALTVIANRNPVGYALGLLMRCLGSTCLLIASLFLWFFISRYKPDYSASFLIDALMLAALISMLFADADEHARLNVARAVHILLVLNCVIAIVERLTGARLFPFVIDGRAQTWDYRATALLGHPLVGALITGVYAVILMTVRDIRGLNERWRLPIVLLCMATMPFLGSRTSFTIVYATAAGIVGLEALRFLRGGAIPIRALLRLIVLGTLGVIAITAMFQAGLFDNFLDRFSDDSGSAETRVLLFHLFDNFSLRDLLIGQGFFALETNIRLNGLTNGIESSWAGHLVRYGLVMSAVLWFGIAGWFVDMLRAGGRGAILPLAFVFLVISTSVGISAKTTMLTIPTILILALIAKAPDVGVSTPAAEDDLPERVRPPTAG